MNKLASFSQKASIKQGGQGIQGIQISPGNQIESGDRLERDIAQHICDKRTQLKYCHFNINNLGHLVDYYWLSIPEELREIQKPNSPLINGLVSEIWSAYFAFQRKIIFWLFEPSIYQKQDLNFYFNPTEHEPFPNQVQSFSFQLDADITAIKIGKDQSGFFQIGQNILQIIYLSMNYSQDYLLCIATQFTIFIYKIQYNNGQINDIISLNYHINTNGEQINQVQILNDSLLIGGSSGSIRRVYWDNVSYSKRAGFLDTIAKQVRRIFGSNTGQLSVKQIEEDQEIQVIYVLVQDKSSDQSYVQIYDSSLDLKLIQIITMDNLVQRLQGQQDNLQLNFISKVTDIKGNLLIVMRTGHVLIIKLGLSQQRLDDPKSMRPNGTFEICSFNKFSMSLQDNFKLYAEDATENQYKQPGVQLPILSMYGAYSDEYLLAIRFGSTLTCQFTDMGQVSYESQLSLMMFPQQVKQALNFSVYKNTSLGVIEHLNLRQNVDDINQQQNMEQLNLEYNLQESNCLVGLKLQFSDGMNDLLQQKSCDLESQCIFGQPLILVSLDKKGASFAIKFRPVDLMFMALKVTHMELLERNEEILPLQVLSQALGYHGSAALLLQIISQPNENYYISKDLEDSMSQTIKEVISKSERVPFNQRYIGRGEDCPIWVIGRVYVLKGNYLGVKARIFYDWLMKREYRFEYKQENIFYEQNKLQFLSCRANSLLIYIRRILMPVYDDHLLEEGLSNNGIECVLKYIDGLILYMQNEYKVHIKNKNKIYNKVDNDGSITIEKIEQNDDGLQGFNKSNFNLIGIPEQQQRLSFLVEGTSEIESEQNTLVSIYNFINQAQQYLKLMLLFRNQASLTINSLSDNDRQELKKISMASLFNQSSNLLILKLQLNQIIKQQNQRMNEIHDQYPWFFDELDFKVIYIQSRIEQLIYKLLNEHIITNPAHSFSVKLKRFLKFDCQVINNQSVQNLVQQNKIQILTTDIPYQDLVEGIKTLLNELSPHINHIQFMKTFKPSLVTLGMHAIYIKSLLNRCAALQIQQNNQNPLNKSSIGNNQSQENLQYIYNREFLDCESCIVLETQNIFDSIMYSESQDQIKLNILLCNVVDVFKDYSLQTIHDLLIKLLIQRQLIHLRLQSKYINENTFDAPILKKYQILLQCHQSRGDKLKTVEYQLKLATFSFLELPEYTYQQILIELPIQKRLDYIFDAQQNLSQLQQEGLNERGATAQFRDFYRRANETLAILKLQKIVYDCLSQQPCEELYQILRSIHQFQQLCDFMFENSIYFAQIMVMDFSEIQQQQNYDLEQHLEKTYQDMINQSWKNCQLKQIIWPDTQLLTQLQYLYDNLIDRERFFILEYLISSIEQKHFSEWNLTLWLPKFLSQDLRIPHNEILRSYFTIILKISDTFQPKELEYQIFFLTQVTNILKSFFDEASSELSARQLLSTSISNYGCITNLLNYQIQIQAFFENKIIQHLRQINSQDHLNMLQNIDHLKLQFKQLIISIPQNYFNQI